MRHRALAATIVTAVAIVGLAAGVAGATADDDGDRNAQLAEAQFEVDLLTNTDLVPTDVTCAAPPATDPNASLLCYALVSDRETVAALAVLVSPGVYRFISINKVDLPESQPALEPAVDNPQQDPTSQTEIDAQILDELAVATSPAAGVDTAILDANPEISTVDNIMFDAPIVTLQVTVTTTTDSQGVRDAIAFSVTDVMAYLWEADEPLRDPSATIKPRFEVIVDGEVYGSSYDMMIGIADYTMTFVEWLELSTGRGAPIQTGRFDDRRVEIKSKHLAAR